MAIYIYFNIQDFSFLKNQLLYIQQFTADLYIFLICERFTSNIVRFKNWVRFFFQANDFYYFMYFQLCTHICIFVVCVLGFFLCFLSAESRRRCHKEDYEVTNMILPSDFQREKKLLMANFFQSCLNIFYLYLYSITKKRNQRQTSSIKKNMFMFSLNSMYILFIVFYVAYYNHKYWL